MSEIKAEAAVAVRKEDKEIVYVPFGSKDEIKLSIGIIRTQIAVKTKSGKLPSDNDCIKFLMMCRSRLLDPWSGDAFLIGYDGRDGATFSLITAHQSFLKRAEVNPDYDGMKSGIIVQEENGEVHEVEGDFYMGPQKVLGGWAKVFKKNQQYPMYKRIRLARFKKPFGIWLEDEAGMIVKCAEADALRSSFPTSLGGLYMREELALDKEVKTADPIFKEPSPEPEPIIDVTPPAEVKTAEVPPERPKAKPSAPKAASKPPEPPKTAPTPVEALKARIHASGVPIQKILDSLNDILGENHDSLESMYLNNKDAFELLERDLDDIVERVKS